MTDYAQLLEDQMVHMSAIYGSPRPLTFYAPLFLQREGAPDWEFVTHLHNQDGTYIMGPDGARALTGKAHIPYNLTAGFKNLRTVWDLGDAYVQNVGRPSVDWECLRLSFKYWYLLNGHEPTALFEHVCAVMKQVQHADRRVSQDKDQLNILSTQLRQLKSEVRS